jgi:heavy metal-binding protein
LLLNARADYASRMHRCFVSLVCRSTLGFLCLLTPLHADPVIPGNVLDPKTAAEAWNVIRLATTNVERLLQEGRLAEITVQIAYCSPALRVLPQLTVGAEDVKEVGPLSERALVLVNTVVKAAKDNNAGGTEAVYANLRQVLDGMAKHFDPKVVKSDIFFCPMHPDFIAGAAGTPCAKCGMHLLTRRIPYSFIYMKPGEPTLRLTAQASGQVEAGEKLEVKIKLSKADNSPVLYDDLMVMHTQPIHLLIEEQGLGDYHHEHPVATETPGEYAFSFTPQRNAPYRVWADVVPVTTGVQELPFTDLPSAGTAGPISDRATKFTAKVNGFSFVLTLGGGNAAPLKANEARRMDVMVSDSEGKPVTRLEPVMSAFAHLVGFYDDFHTVVHLHPTGGDVTAAEARGGPGLSFMFFPPSEGFIRLYCQVSVDGRMLFAPFNVNVVP